MATSRCGRSAPQHVAVRMALAGLAVATFAAGCGTGSSPAPASGAPAVGPPTAADLAAVTSAAARTLGYTASVSVDLDAAQVFGSSATRVRGDGGFDLRAGRGEAQVRQPAGVETVVFVPALVYVHQPPSATGALPPGKTWILAPLTQSETVATNFPQFVLQVEDLNPALLLGQVAWGATSAAPLAAGSSTRGYLVRVDLARAASHTVGPAAVALTRAMQFEQTALGGGPGASAPPVEVRVWVDGSGRVVQIQSSPPGSGVGTTTFALSGFGSRVTVSPPLLSQVVDIATLTPAGERENNGRGDSDGA